MRLRRGWMAVAVALLAVVPIRADYIATDLLETFNLSPTGFNSQGQFTGTRDFGAGNNAFLFQPSTGFLSLGTLGGVTSSASSIADTGLIVGQSRVSTTSLAARAFAWSPEQGLKDLGTLGGRDSTAAAVNSLGWVVGNSQTRTGSSVRNAFLWQPGVGITNLGTLGGLESFATGINSAGSVVGNSQTSMLGQSRGFLWSPGGEMINLGSLAGATGSSRASAINDANQVVGVSDRADGTQAAFLWTAAGGMTDLGTLGGANALALGINSRGEVIGAAEDAGGELRAFVWDSLNGMRDLNTLIASGLNGRNLTGAFAINDEGQILVTNTLVDSGSTVLLTPLASSQNPNPVPAPAGLLLGIVALGFLSMRRRRL